MANSIFVPVRHVPQKLEQVRHAVRRTFEGFGLPPPSVRTDRRLVATEPLMDAFIIAEGTGPGDHCWFSFEEYPVELTGADCTCHMVSVTTRGNWLFGALVVLAQFDFGGTTAFNDGGELDGQHEYDEASLRQLVSRAISAGNPYRAW